MRQSQKLTLFALAALLGGCSDTALAPSSSQPATPAGTFVFGGGATEALSATDTTRFTFTIDPSQATLYSLGDGNTVSFPAGTVCDPATSGYGRSKWDAACAPLATPLTIDAKAWIDHRGHTRVDFSPNIRFVPSTDPAKWVTMIFRDPLAAGDTAWKIYYCMSPRSGCIDESRSDSDLRTYRDPVTGKITRRLKHFSGYNVAAGDACDPSIEDPNCTEGSTGMTNRTAGAALNLLTTLVDGLLRDRPVGKGHQASAVIGAAGGVLRLPSAGLTLTVPAGAVSGPTTFSVTARPGRFMAYEFEPHGTTFAVPLTLEQDIHGVHLPKGRNVTYYGVFYADDSQLDEHAGTANASELLPATLDDHNKAATFQIKHFSGYMLASGRE